MWSLLIMALVCNRSYPTFYVQPSSLCSPHIYWQAGGWPFFNFQTIFKRVIGLVTAANEAARRDHSFCSRGCVYPSMHLPTLPGSHLPPQRWQLKRGVHVLLECILVK